MACPYDPAAANGSGLGSGDAELKCPYNPNASQEEFDIISDGSNYDDDEKDEKEEEIDHSKLIEIPKPKHQNYFGLLGHAPDLDAVLPVRSYWRLMDEYSPIFQLDLGMAHPRVFLGNRELVDEMADDDRFTKFTHRLHKEMRPVFGDGLFSAESTDRNWWKAHRLLAPALGPLGLSKMFDDMQDLSAQLVMKWERFGPDYEVECLEDMARLAFDTVGLCAFGFRFNEFYSEGPHPFMVQLKEAIVESGKRANRPDALNRFYYKEEQHRQDNIAKMKILVQGIIKERLDNPQPDARDLLNTMLHGIDRETGEKLSLENVAYQLPTFLGAGYETTSSSLAFVYYFLVSNPRALKKAQEEVDQILGLKVMTYEMIPQLKYLDACIKEALRLQHPSSLLTRFAVKDTVIGGKYFIHKGQMVSGVWRHFHRDPEIWGEDADEFRPERMLEVNFQKLPSNAWKPFGDGLRACIGRGFAEQEMLINIAMVLQKFDIEKSDPKYELLLKGQMAVKPIGFKIKVHRRPGRGMLVGVPGGGEVKYNTTTKEQKAGAAAGGSTESKKPFTILWGGNMGTCESLAEELSRTAPDFGLQVADFRNLDDATDDLPTDKPFVIIVPSYDGKPPENAKKFCAWLDKAAAQGQKLPSSTQYSIFGVGNNDWNTTFHKIPNAINDAFVKLGASRFHENGFANVKYDLTGPWEAWSEAVCLSLSGATERKVPEQVGVEVQIDKNSITKAVALGQDETLSTGKVVASYQLADSSISTAKHHLDVLLPEGVTYRAGDYLVVHGRNSEEKVTRVMKRFGLNPEDVMTVKSTKKSFLPSHPIAVEHFLRSYVELGVPATKRQLATIAGVAEPGTRERTRLDNFQSETTYERLLAMRYSVIDILEEVPNVEVPFGVYISLLTPMTPRVYSISSSPLDPKNQTKDGLIASITFDVLEGPALSGHGQFNGVASSYLGARKIGDEVPCLVRATTVPFQLPTASEIPIVMFAAGSGLAPMRAFLQERAQAKAAGASVGPAVLFFGCHHPEKNYLYRDEMQAWEQSGIVELVPCFSRPDQGQKSMYVHHALWERRDHIWELFENGAKFFICGSAAKLGRSTAETWRKVYMEKLVKTELESHEWLDEIKVERYVSDVY